MVMATEELVPSGEVKLIWQPINRARDRKRQLDRTMMSVGPKRRNYAVK